jgi:hypothetical protein
MLGIQSIQRMVVSSASELARGVNVSGGRNKHPKPQSILQNIVLFPLVTIKTYLETKSESIVSKVYLILLR